MPPVQLALPLALMVGAAIAATTTPSRSDIREIASTARLSGLGDGVIERFADAHPAMRMLRVSIGPGSSLPWLIHTAPEAGYVLEGELRVQAPTGDLHLIRPGDSIAVGSSTSRHGVAGPHGATVVLFFENDA